MKLTSLLQVVDKLQQADKIDKLQKGGKIDNLQKGGKIDKLQRVCTVFGCVFVFKRKKPTWLFCRA